MTVKLLDIEYLRKQGASTGQVIIAASSTDINTAGNIFVIDNKVGIRTNSPSAELSVIGNVAVFGSSNGFVFSDGTHQTTKAVTMLPGGTQGYVQFYDNNNFNGSINLYFDKLTSRLGIGTSIPRSTLQIKDVGYESTDTTADNLDTVILDSFPATHYRSCHYIVQVTDNDYSWFHTSQIMIIHDGIKAFKSEYNIVITQQKLGEFESVVSLGNVNLTFTPFYSSNKNIKVIRTSIEP